MCQVVEEILVRCMSTGEERQAQDPNQERFRKALVSLCQGGYMKHRHLRPKFEETAAELCRRQGKSFEDFKSLLV